LERCVVEPLGQWPGRVHARGRRIVLDVALIVEVQVDAVVDVVYQVDARKQRIVVPPIAPRRQLLSRLK
jgi:hypothetical protein